MDQVIFEEFKGTGNSELVLSRELAERRIYPAIDLLASATRREELLLSDEALTASGALRQRIAGMTPINAMSDLLTDLKRHPTNDGLIRAKVKGGRPVRGTPGRPRKEALPRKRRGSTVPLTVRRGVKARLEQLLKARGWSKTQLAEFAEVGPSTVTPWFGEPSTIPSGASLCSLAENVRVCPRWLLLGDRDLAPGGLSDESWHSVLRGRIRSELLQRGHVPGFIDRFLPEASDLADQIVTDWLARAIPAERIFFDEARQTTQLNSIHQLRTAEAALRISESRDPASTIAAPTIAVRAGRDRR